MIAFSSRDELIKEAIMCSVSFSFIAVFCIILSLNLATCQNGYQANGQKNGYSKSNDHSYSQSTTYQQHGNQQTTIVHEQENSPGMAQTTVTKTISQPGTNYGNSNNNGNPNYDANSNYNQNSQNNNQKGKIYN